MEHKTNFTDEQLRYLRMLSKQYPTVQAASKELVRLNAVLNLPKGTEHFMSDIHGEYDAFFHIFNSCSGEVKAKVEELFGTTLSRRERNELATLIYYPVAKLALAAEENEDLD
ncbi:MAG: fructose-bisphosphatase class III, partial [Oscillospiraceae bacterium]|nr:fructose-bisphosphatase class III [Oscillospiraceae bacterium]